MINQSPFGKTLPAKKKKKQHLNNIYGVHPNAAHQTLPEAHWIESYKGGNTTVKYKRPSKHPIRPSNSYRKPYIYMAN
jgi:hypothetical protein